jgi:DDE superfamily endonuclease
MRSGTRSQCKRRWTPRGHRPQCRMKLGYQYCYLYAALNPYTGSLFSLILPDMTKDSFGVFTDHFSHYLDGLYGMHSEQRNKVLLIADGAGAHLEELCTNQGFDLKKLPAASPELNPVERFFEELRKDLADHVFDTIEQVEAHLISILQKYYQNPQVIMQLTQFPYISLPT